MWQQNQVKHIIYRNSKRKTRQKLMQTWKAISVFILPSYIQHKHTFIHKTFSLSFFKLCALLLFFIRFRFSLLLFFDRKRNLYSNLFIILNSIPAISYICIIQDTKLFLYACVRLCLYVFNENNVVVYILLSTAMYLYKEIVCRIEKKGNSNNNNFIQYKMDNVIRQY